MAQGFKAGGEKLSPLTIGGLFRQGQIPFLAEQCDEIIAARTHGGRCPFLVVAQVFTQRVAGGLVLEEDLELVFIFLSVRFLVFGIGQEGEIAQAVNQLAAFRGLGPELQPL